MEERKKIVVICGPTASGKTGLSLVLANKFNGEIISADSMQVYKQLDIGTAKATKEEQSLAKHHLIDFLDPSAVSYTHLTLPTTYWPCRSRWSPYH